MANQLDPMDIKQILTLHLDGYSNRKIGETLGISRNTVNAYMKLFNACEYSARELLELDSAALAELFPSHTTIRNPRFDELMMYFEKVNHARDHPGFTFLHHYRDYSLQSREPYSYTQFMEHYNRRHSKTKGSMKLEHEAGRELFIDYAGTKMHIVDRDTGELRAVDIFVATLPYSLHTYIEASLSQKREDLISSLNNTLGFYGGVTKAIVCDNLKSAVTRASKYEPDINRSLKEFALHYNCVINPTRAYSPQDKALVENAVQLAYQRIYYPMREMTFFSLGELNREIRKRLVDFNDMLYQRKGASRRELFQSVERAYLKPLPETPYQMKDYLRAKVQKIGYVYFSADKSYYSVPYRYVGKSTLIHYTKTTVEVYYSHERIATHPRNESKGLYNTVKDHLGSTHKVYTDWSPDYFGKMAAGHGDNVLACVEALFIDCDYPETSYKSAMGIIQLHRQYGSERLDNACRRAVYGNAVSFRRIRNILEKNLDRADPEDALPGGIKSHIPFHENIRGPKNYK
ncbi:MAG: IS21 family transposase [Lunatimonas sp.]|uniref:IS21 family transposase n=1 Tax=Lunatimonas sp. TaxID=2060141 RepID=UPI00263AD573|nr:IS21 family transposase [Lunatimonas sp.]MCC5936169.1 IS21 family transposase [Lunatimonas sp.]